MGNYKPTEVDGACVFCNIVARNHPDELFWEDDKHVAFLSIDPNTPGFSVVIPKQHYGSDVLKMPDNELQDFVLAAKHAASVLEHFYADVGRVGLIMEGTGIDHAHIKLVPMHDTKHMKRGKWKQYLSDVEHWFDQYEGWISSAGGPLQDRESLIELSKDIRKSWQK